MIQALDGIGARRVLRTARDAADRELESGRGLRSWCFDRATPKDVGRFVAARLSVQPFIDGPAGLFAAHEGAGAVEARIGSEIVFGAGLAALTASLEGSVLLILASEDRPAAERLAVDLSYLDESGERAETVYVQTFATSGEVEKERSALVERVSRSIADGSSLVERFGEVFPMLRLGGRARNQIGALKGSEAVFLQLVRHLRALNEGALRWKKGEPFEPIAVTYSVESMSTLQDRALGSMRYFPSPPGFEVERWSLHTKLTGGAGARLYFHPVQALTGPVVLIGYFGAHLPTVNYPT